MLMKIKFSFIIIILFFSINSYAQKNVNISSVEAFINALDNNTKINITVDTLNFSKENLEKITSNKLIKNYFNTKKGYTIDNSGLTLHGYNNLTIESKKNANIISNNPDDDILTFRNCTNINLVNLSLFHTVGVCGGLVLKLILSNTVQIENCNLNGSGAIGAYIVGTDNVNFNNVNLFNNNSHAVYSYNSKDIIFNNSEIYSNNNYGDSTYGKTLIYSTLSEISFANCSFYKNTSEDLYNNPESHYIYKYIPSFTNCNFTDNDFEYYGEEIETEYYEENTNSEILKATFKAFITEQIDVYNTTDFKKSNRLLSFFSKKNSQLLNAENEILENNFSSYFKNDQQISHRKVELLDYYKDDNNNFIATLNSAIITEENSELVTKTEETWCYIFNENYKVSGIKNMNNQELSSKKIAPFEVPKIDNEDLQLELQILDEYVKYQIFDQETNQYDIKYVLNAITGELNNLFFPSFQEKWSSINANDIIKLDNYLWQLKNFIWNKFDESYIQKNGSDLQVWQTEILAFFQDVWNTAIKGYTGDQKIEPLNNQTYNITLPKVPFFKNKGLQLHVFELRAEYLGSINNMFFENINYTNALAVLEDDIENSFNPTFENIKDELGNNDKTLLKQYFEAWRTVAKETEKFIIAKNKN